MKQLYCPHKVTISGIQQYCKNGKFPVDCEHCDCPDKQMLNITVTTDFVIPPKNKTDSLYVMYYDRINKKLKSKAMTREEELELGSYQAYPSNVEYSFVGNRLKDYNSEQRQIWLEGAKWADKTMIDKACEWLLSHNDYQRVLDNGKDIRFDMTQCVMDFRKAMEE